MASVTVYAENPIGMHYSGGTVYGDGWHGYPRYVF